MDTLFKGKYENLKTYEYLEDVNNYFKEVLNIIEKIEIPTEQQLVEIEEVLWELSDQYWHNYPKKLTGDIKIRLETFIKRYFYYAEDNFIFTIYTLKLDACYPWVRDIFNYKTWESNHEKLFSEKEFNDVMKEKDYPWNKN
jgi:hypothetical protein